MQVFSKGFLIGSVLLALLSGAVIAKDDRQQIRIVGGEESAEGAWPFMTALVRKGASAENGQICGASFIGKRYVLTASHCVEGATAEDLEVVIGIHDLKKESTQGKRVAITNISMHENYSSPVELNNDIALLELASDVAGVTAVKPATPAIMQLVKTGDPLTVMGWGNRSGSGEDFSSILHQVVVPLYDREACKAAYSGLTEQMLCAGLTEGGKDSCQGDSGGPIVMKHNDELYQVGIVSFGDGCAVAGKPGVYAKVSAFEAWLKQKTSGVSLSSQHQLGYVESDFQGEYTFQLANYTNAILNIGNATLINPNNVQNHEVVENNCTSGSVAVNSQCQVKIRVKALQPGESSIQLRLDTDNAAANQVISTLSFTALPAVSFDANAAMDSTNVNWYTSTESGWTEQSDQVSQGSKALQSGAITHSQRSILLAVINNADKVSLDFKTSTEESYDFFEVYVDAKKVFSRSGKMDNFETKAFEFPAGKHRVVIAYAKDSEESANDDKVYIDKFVVGEAANVNQPPQAIVENSNIEVVENSNVAMSAQNSKDPEGGSLTYLWSQISGTSVTINGKNTAKASFKAPEVSQDEVLSFKVVVTDAQGATAEKAVNVKVTNKAVAPAPTPAPASAAKSSGGGSMGVMLILGLLVALRRTFAQNTSYNTRL